MRKIALLLLFFCHYHNTSAQGWMWAKDCRITPTGTSEGGPVTIDKEGNIYGINNIGSLLFGPGIITSTYGPFSVTDSLDLSQSIVYSIDSAGNYRWATGTYGDVVRLDHIFTDDASNVYLSGYKNAPAGIFAGMSIPGPVAESFIVKINSSGYGIWIKNLPAGIDVTNINVSHSGDIYFTGDLRSAPITFGTTTITGHNGSDVILGKYDSSGNQKWALSFGGDSTDAGSFISVTDNGAVYLSGRSESSSLVIGPDTLINPSGLGYVFFFVSRIDTGKRIAWSKSIIPSPNGGSTYGVASDNLDNLYCGGTYFSIMSSGNDTLPLIGATHSGMFLFRYDSSGHLKWARTITDTSLTSCTSIDADNCGNVWVSGQGGHVSAVNTDPMFLARFDSSGNLSDTLFLSSGGDDENWLILDKTGHLYVSGDYESNPFSVGTDTLDSVGINEALFVAKYIYDFPNCIRDTIPYHHVNTGIGTVRNNNYEIMLFPNPAANEFTVHSDNAIAANSRMEIYDISGRLIDTYKLDGNNTAISTSTFHPGVYQCSIYTGGNTVITKKLVIIK
jgi:hypothetical protein